MVSSDVAETIDEKQPTIVNDDASRMEAKTAYGGIILIPQPSNDSRDPLV